MRTLNFNADTPPKNKNSLIKINLQKSIVPFQFEDDFEISMFYN